MIKRTVSILALLFIFSISYTQTAENIPDGYQVFKYPNGSKSSEGNIKNGKPDGFWKSYYVTGVKKAEGKRTNFLLDSIWVFYDQTGDTVEKINYLYGKKNGWYYKYKKEPSEGLYIWSKELFAGDKKEGTSYVYFPDQKIQQTITWYNGKKSGLSKEFDREGTVITLLEYNNDFLTGREKINRKDGNGLKQGDWKEFYPNGNIKSEKTFKDDLLHGYYKEYDIKGNLVLTMLYENGAIVKSNVEDQPDIEIKNRYDQNGKLIYSGPFRNSVPVGIHREYNSDGKISDSKIYNDNGLLISEGIVNEQGDRNGKWSDFFPSGKVMDEGQYTENRRSGLWKFYEEEGKTEQTGYFNNGRPDGIWKWYYENGSLLREEEYFQGKRDGAYTEYSKSGEIIAQGQYSDGERNGEWKFKSANNTEEGKYITGLKDGVWRSYYSDGKPRFKGSFLQGVADGQHMLYYEDGKLKEERYYQGGLRVKTWKKYDEDGKVILTVSYRNDTELSINGVKIKLPENDVKLIK
jgi:antitoxin component YwqK of YwqJK toxin-antitoxin module